jgi:hypothetical protein
VAQATDAVGGPGAGVSVTPSSAAPGAEVAVRASGCGVPTATAASAAFTADARLTGTGGTLAGDARIRTGAGPGTYELKLTCGDAVIDGRVTVAAAAVPAGGGANTHFASVDVRGAGPGTGQAITGLVLAGVAAVAVGLLTARRRRGSRK